MNYQESNISGTVYTRAFKIVIDNALGQNPSIHYQQEQVATLEGGERFQKLVGSVSATLTPENGSEEFPLVHPTTGKVLGTGTPDGLQLYMFSHWLATVNKTEAAAATPPTAP